MPPDIIPTSYFNRQLLRLTAVLQQQFQKRIQLLDQNPRHPSLQVRKILGSANIYEGRVNHKYRFTFELAGCRTILRNIDNHDECIKKP